MSLRKILAATALGAAAGMLISLPGRAQQTGSFHRTFTVNGPVTLEVTTGSGSIQVTGTSGNTVTVDGTVHQSFDWLGGGADPAEIRQVENNPPITQAGNNIDIHGPRSGWNSHIWISYVIVTPANTQLEAHTGSGHIEVNALGGTSDLEAGSGDLRAANLAGSLRAQTGSGSISFDRVGGDARCDTGSGSIEGNEVAGRFSADTGSGDVQVQRLDNGGEVHTASGRQELDNVRGDLSAHAASGSIRVSGTLDGNHRWNLSAASGSIGVTLEPHTSARISLGTSSGRMVVDQPVRTQGEVGRRQWEGVLGDGPATAVLTAHTSSGSIHVH